jgi:NADH-quinone oxidoreductase subunit G
VVDLCPVGSLISKDFLHKARAWDLDKTASVCSGCSQGCNTMIDTRDNVVVRLRPRANLEVNRHFICDHGRMTYRWLNRGDRIEAPLLNDGHRLSATTWDVAFLRLAALVKAGGKAVVLGSASASTESLGLLARLLRGMDVQAAVQVPTGEEAPLQGIPNLALRAERVPNADGARLLGYSTDWAAAIRSAPDAALVVVLDATLTDAEVARASAGRALVVFGTVQPQELPKAQLVLPVTNLAEEIGTFVNRDLRVQRYDQAKSAPGMARPAWWVAAEALALVDASFDPPATAAEAFELLSAEIGALGGLTYGDLGLTGRIAGQSVGAGA